MTDPDKAPSLRAALAGKKLLIFDFDGTIADTSAIHARAFAEVLGPLGIAFDYSQIAGQKTADAIEFLLRRCGHSPSREQVAALAAEKQRRSRLATAQSLEPLPGAREFLDWAGERFRLALATSGSRPSVDIALDALGLTGYFDPYVTADDVVRAKPHPELFLTALSKSGYDAGESLVFEDSESGFRAAAAAQIAWVDARKNLWEQLQT